MASGGAGTVLQAVAVAIAVLVVSAALVVLVPDGDSPVDSTNANRTEGGDVDLSQSVDGDLLVGPETLHTWQAATDRFGTPPGNRPTGSIAAHGYIDLLETKLNETLGPEQVQREAFTFPKWEEPAPSNVSLEVLEGEQQGPVDVAAYIPYSGSTSLEGVQAPLVYLGADTDPATVGAADVRGKIVIVDVPPVPLTVGAFEAISYYEHDPNDTMGPATPYERSWVSQIPLTEQMRALSEAGAAGIVAVLDLPEEAAEGAYFPYEGEVYGIPGVFVDRQRGDELKQAASPDGVPARLTLESHVEPEATSYNLVATIPGTTNESILLHSHTDGPNSIEDNGPWGVLALADYFAQVPREDRQRTIHIALTDGHFAGGFSGGVGAWRFVEAHEDDILEQTVAALSLEHFGAREYLPTGDGDYELTGHNEMTGFFIPENEPLVQETIAMVKGEDLARHVLMRPFEASQEEPGERVWPGEGMVFHLAGIPTIQFISGPTYLLNAGPPTTDELTDYPLFHRQVRGFAQLVTNLSHVPADELASRDYTTAGQPSSILPIPGLEATEPTASDRLALDPAIGTERSGVAS